ncbi:hypothetical protein B8W72_23510 [Pseudomonas putida]|uniref:Uncharacterized protein n=1 Tax=Pseudomonas putida TaxID=303 RepID=A0A1Y3KTA9_PSEPU|nr:hypothetical protein B8W72_23510 [Pseudomonas putida]
MDFRANAGGLGIRPGAEHLRMQSDERQLDSRGFLIVQPNPFGYAAGIEAVVQGDVAEEGSGLGTLLNNFGFEGFGVVAALRVHGKSA